MSKIRYTEGSVRVELSDDLEKLVRSALDSALPGVFDMIEDAQEKILKDAEARWPVKTGDSKGSLNHYVLLTPTSIKSYVVADASYAKYVKSFKNGLGGKAAGVELLNKPNQEFVTKLLKELGPKISEALKK